MKRSETLIVDLKVKSYDTIKLKQLDTTELNFKVLDNSSEIDLSAFTANLIFKKPNRANSNTRSYYTRKFY